jgi:hypothetical protein
MHIYEVRPRCDHRGVDLITDALPFDSPVVWRAPEATDDLCNAMKGLPDVPE